MRTNWLMNAAGMLALAISGAAFARPLAANTITRIGSFDRIYTSYVSLNDRGDVAGEVNHLIWTRTAAGKETTIDLGNLNFQFGGLNNRGEFLYTTNYANQPPVTLYRYRPGLGVDILESSAHTPTNTFNYTMSGQTAAMGTNAHGPMRAMRYDPGVGFVDLGGTGYREGRAINENGQVAAIYQTNSTSAAAAIHTPATGWRNLGSLGGGWTWVEGMNDLGDVVGASNIPGGFGRAFVVLNGMSMQSLGVTPGFENSRAIDINNNRWVIGQSDYTDFFLWTQWTGRVNLQDLLPSNSGWTVTGLWDINNNNQILGVGQLAGVGPQLFILDLHTIPAASSLTIPGAAAALGLRRRRRSLRQG